MFQVEIVLIWIRFREEFRLIRANIKKQPALSSLIRVSNLVTMQAELILIWSSLIKFFLSKFALRIERKDSFQKLNTNRALSFPTNRSYSKSSSDYCRSHFYIIKWGIIESYLIMWSALNQHWSSVEAITSLCLNTGCLKCSIFPWKRLIFAKFVFNVRLCEPAKVTQNSS